MVELGTFAVPRNVLREHMLACDSLIGNLAARRRVTLEYLFGIVQEGGQCADCGPESIIHLGINMGDDLPVPVLDVRAPQHAEWGGLHAPFLTGRDGKTEHGHFIVRNFVLDITPGFTRDEFLEAVLLHERCHVLQAISGRHSDLMTPEELLLAQGHVGLLPAVAGQGMLAAEHAFDLGGRWFLQHLRGELEVWHTVNFPRAKRKAADGKLHLDLWRKGALVVILRPLIRPVCGAFLDTYQLRWRDLVASVRERLEGLVAGTFLEEPIPTRAGPLTVISCLDSVRPHRGLLRNRGLDPAAFAVLTLLMPRVGGAVIYDASQEKARRFLADGAQCGASGDGLWWRVPRP